MLIKPIHTTIFEAGDSLEDFIARFIPAVSENSIIVVTSKIVAVSQRRIVSGGSAEKVLWIKKESEKYIKTKWCYLTLKNGQWCANAGIDESNSQGGGLILLPKDPYRDANKLRKKLLKLYRVKKLGVIITDSRIFPLRQGVTGVAIGYAGFQGIRNYIGLNDLFGRQIMMTKTNVADSLAAAAVLEMGEGSEQIPLAVITGVSRIAFTERVEKKELQMDPKDDLYRPLFQRKITNSSKKGGKK